MSGSGRGVQPRLDLRQLEHNFVEHTRAWRRAVGLPASQVAPPLPDACTGANSVLTEFHDNLLYAMPDNSMVHFLQQHPSMIVSKKSDRREKLSNAAKSLAPSKGVARFPDRSPSGLSHYDIRGVLGGVFDIPDASLPGFYLALAGDDQACVSEQRKACGKMFADGDWYFVQPEPPSDEEVERAVRAAAAAPVEFYTPREGETRTVDRILCIAALSGATRSRTLNVRQVPVPGAPAGHVAYVLDPEGEPRVAHKVGVHLYFPELNVNSWFMMWIAERIKQACARSTPNLVLDELVDPACCTTNGLRTLYSRKLKDCPLCETGRVARVRRAKQLATSVLAHIHAADAELQGSVPGLAPDAVDSDADDGTGAADDRTGAADDRTGAASKAGEGSSTRKEGASAAVDPLLMRIDRQLSWSQSSAIPEEAAESELREQHAAAKRHYSEFRKATRGLRKASTRFLRSYTNASASADAVLEALDVLTEELAGLDVAWRGRLGLDKELAEGLGTTSAVEESAAAAVAASPLPFAGYIDSGDLSVPHAEKPQSRSGSPGCGRPSCRRGRVLSDSAYTVKYVFRSAVPARAAAHVPVEDASSLTVAVEALTAAQRMRPLEQALQQGTIDARFKALCLTSIRMPRKKEATDEYGNLLPTLPFHVPPGTPAPPTDAPPTYPIALSYLARPGCVSGVLRDVARPSLGFEWLPTKRSALVGMVSVSETRVLEALTTLVRRAEVPVPPSAAIPGMGGAGGPEGRPLAKVYRSAHVYEAVRSDDGKEFRAVIRGPWSGYCPNVGDGEPHTCTGGSIRFHVLQPVKESRAIVVETRCGCKSPKLRTLHKTCKAMVFRTRIVDEEAQRALWPSLAADLDAPQRGATKSVERWGSHRADMRRMRMPSSPLSVGGGSVGSGRSVGGMRRAASSSPTSTTTPTASSIDGEDGSPWDALSATSCDPSDAEDAAPPPARVYGKAASSASSKGPWVSKIGSGAAPRPPEAGRENRRRRRREGRASEPDNLRGGAAVADAVKDALSDAAGSMHHEGASAFRSTDATAGGGTQAGVFERLYNKRHKRRRQETS